MNDNQQTPVVATGTNAAQNTTQASAIDYDKIQGMIDSRNQRNEDSILKNYFQKQGMSEDDMKDAIRTYKENKSKKVEENQINLTNLQNQLNDSTAKYQKLQIESEAYKQASELKVDSKTIPYLIKMADFKGCLNDKEEILPDKVKESLNKVLEDIPNLKSIKTDEKIGIKVGADTSNATQASGNLFNFGFTGVRKH